MIAHLTLSIQNQLLEIQKELIALNHPGFFEKTVQGLREVARKQNWAHFIKMIQCEYFGSSINEEQTQLFSNRIKVLEQSIGVSESGLEELTLLVDQIFIENKSKENSSERKKLGVQELVDNLSLEDVERKFIKSCELGDADFIKAIIESVHFANVSARNLGDAF
mgnify:CR=1 FL=1